MQAIKLNPQYYFSGPSSNVKNAWKVNINEFKNACDSSTRQYVKISDPYHNNCSSIGFVAQIENFGSSLTDWQNRFQNGRLIVKYVLPDGKIRQNKVALSQVDWLKGYVGNTTYVAPTVAAPEVVPTLDRLGRQLEVGQFVCYILHHFEYSGAHTYFGTITKITKHGTVYCKNIALDSEDHVDEKKVNDNTTILIMNDQIMNDLMIKRLSI